MAKLTKNSTGIIILAIAVVAFLAFGGLRYFDVAYMLPIPTQIYSGTVYTSPSQLINGNTGQPTGSGLVTSGAYYVGTTGAVIFPIDWFQSFYNGNNNQLEDVGYTNLYVAVNKTGATYASASDTSEVPSINSTIATLQAQLKANQNSNACGYNSGSCNAQQGQITAWTQIRNILLSGVVYNNGLLSSGISASTTTTSTTVGSSTTISSGSSTAPPSAINLITSFFSGISSYINSLISQLFNTNITYSIAVSSSGSQVGKQQNVTANLTIPSGNQTIKWSSGTNKVVQTSCSYYVVNQTTYVLQGPITNVSGSSYAASFSYTPKLAGAYGFGAACVSAQNIWNTSLQRWNGWSTPVLISQANTTLIFTSGSTTAPTTVNLSNGFFSAIQNIVNWIQGILKQIGL